MSYSNQELITIIHESLAKVMVQKSRPVVAFEADQNLVTDLALDSLDLAQLVALLELRLGFDPFSTNMAIAEIHTVDDLCEAYAHPHEPGGE